MKNKAFTKNTKPFNNKQPTYFSWFFYISIFLIAVLCVNWWVTPDCNNNNDISPGSVFAPNNSSHNPYLIKKIKIIELPTQDENYNAKLFKEAAAGKEPVIFRNTSVENWGARKRWNPKYIKENVSKFHGVHRKPIWPDNKEGHQNISTWNPSLSENTFLYFRKDQAFYNHLIKFNPSLSDPTFPSEIVDSMDSSEFFRILQTSKLREEKGEKENRKERRRDDEYYYYYSDDAFSFSNKLMKNDIGNTDIFAFIDEGKLMNIWIGGNNVTAQTHYDSNHNFYLQFYGKKRFHLFPPTSWRSFYLYPGLHPCFRQSQVNLNDPASFSDFPAFNPHLLTAFEAILEPGDVLYLPPFWFHYVTALSDISISFNIWFDGEELKTIDSVRSFPVPFEENWSPDQNLQALILYIKLILREFHVSNHPSSTNASNFIKEEFLESRYSQIIKHSILPHQWLPQTNLTCASGDPSFLDKFYSIKFQNRAKDLVVLFNQLPPGIREIVLGNFIEEMINYFIGSDAVLPSLFNCFT